MSVPIDPQIEAAHDSSPIVRLIAGPGAGKSRSIRERVRWLLDGAVSPRDIYIVSFTVFSVEDLRREIHEYLRANGYEAQAPQLHISTLHSVALRMLRQAQLLEHYPVSPIVMDTWQEKYIFDSEFAQFAKITPTRAAEIRNAYEASWETLDEAVFQMKQITNAERGSFDAFHSEFRQVFSGILPGEMVKQCLDHIRSGTIDPISLTNASEVIVDEFQDLNKCDQDFIDAFQRTGVRLFVAGDDDQSLYSFRNAAPDGIVNFLSRYPGASPRILPTCYRCTPNVLTPALSLIEHNQPRVEKTFVSNYQQTRPSLGGVFSVWRYDDGETEARFIAQSCRQLIEKGMSQKDIMILVADKNLQCPLLEQSLDVENVSYETPRAMAMKDSDGGRAILSVLCMIKNQDDLLSFRTLLGLYDAMGPGRCAKLRRVVVDRNIRFKDLLTDSCPRDGLRRVELGAVDHLRVLYERISGWTSEDTIGTRQDEIRSIIQAYFGETSTIYREAIEILERTLLTVLPSETKLGEVLSYFQANREAEREEIVQAIYARLHVEISESLQPTPKVRIMTFHGSKGLSAPVVFIPGLETKILPNGQGIAIPGKFKEQRRMLYVGITRARLACFASVARQRNGQQAQRLVNRWNVSMQISPFVTEMNVRIEDRTTGLSESDANRIIEGMSQL